MSSLFTVKTKLFNIYLKKQKLMKICDNTSLIKSVFSDTKKEEIKVVNDLRELLNEQCSSLMGLIKENPVEVFKMQSRKPNELLTYSILNKLVLADSINNLRLMNEIIEDDINNLLRDMLNNEMSINSNECNSKDNNSGESKDYKDNKVCYTFSPEFKNSMIRLRDDYKKIIPNEVVFDNKNKGDKYENDDYSDRALIYYFKDKLVSEVSQKLNTTNMFMINKLL